MLENKAFHAEVGTRIAACRRDSRMTQDDLAMAVGLARTSITNIEKGRQSLTAYTLCSIAEVLGVEFTRLLPRQQICDTEDRLQALIQDKPGEERKFISHAVKAALKGKRV